MNRSRSDRIVDNFDLRDLDGSPVENSDRPSPADIITFLPWACIQLQTNFCILITKTVQHEYIGTDKTKGKGKGKPSPGESDVNKSDKVSISALDPVSSIDSVVKICAIYEGDNLVQIKFEDNLEIPCKAVKIVNFVLRYHSYLTTLSIKGGLRGNIIYEIGNALLFSNLTDICLDDSPCVEGNYHLLLEKENHLRHISLCRCNINDEVLKNIALCLHYPKPASKNLCLLNLSSNYITDIGISYVAEAMRTNRRLNYLNVSNNQLTDDGAFHIFKVLLQFPLKNEEILTNKSRHFDYLKEKDKLIDDVLKQIKFDDLDKKGKRKATASAKPIGASVKKSKIIDKETSLSIITETSKAVDPAVYERAEWMAVGVLGQYNDPYMKENITVTNSYPYCKGNNTLCYLNLAYNNLSYCSLCKLITVIEYQKLMDRKPRGLLNVVIDGNNMPHNCKELQKIDYLLTMSILASTKRMSYMVKKKPGKPGK